MRHSSLLDADSRVPEHYPPRVAPPAGCRGCGQARLYRHALNRDGSRAVTCMDCGRKDVRLNRRSSVPPQASLAAVQILGDVR